MSQNIEEAQESASTLCQAIPPVVFHPDAPAFSPIILTRGSEWSSLPVHANTAHAYPALTKTAAPNPATPAAVWGSKRNPNCTQPTDGQTAFPNPPANPYSDVLSAASFGGGDGDSDYVESVKNLPMGTANTPDLARHISKLGEMHEVLKGEIDAISLSTVLT